MRILYAANVRLPSERANTIQIINTCHALARQGAQVELVVRWMRHAKEKESLAFYGLEPIAGLRLRRLPVVNLPQPRLWNGSFYLSLAVWAGITSLRHAYDVVYTREGIVARLFGWLRPWHRAKVVHERHELSRFVLEAYDARRSGKPLAYEALPKDAEQERRGCERVDGVVTLTHHMAAALRDVLNIRRPIGVIPDGASVVETPSTTMPSEEPFICYTGQLYRWKGLDTLVMAMDYLQSPAKLIIVGGRPNPEPVDLTEMAELRDLIHASRRAQDVVLTGFVEPHQVRRYQEQCQAAVLTLSDELVPRYCNSPLKLFEYMALGKPIVATRLPAIEEVLSDGENALLVEPGNPKALAQAIDRILGDPELAHRLGQKAFEDAQRYSWDERARAILRFTNGLGAGS